MPLFDKMNASLQRERGKGMHHIPKSIYLRQIIVIDWCSASKNLSEKYRLSVTVTKVATPGGILANGFAISCENLSLVLFLLWMWLVSFPH